VARSATPTSPRLDGRPRRMAGRGPAVRCFIDVNRARARPFGRIGWRSKRHTAIASPARESRSADRRDKADRRRASIPDVSEEYRNMSIPTGTSVPGGETGCLLLLQDYGASAGATTVNRSNLRRADPARSSAPQSLINGGDSQPGFSPCATATIRLGRSPDWTSDSRCRPAIFQKLSAAARRGQR